MIREKQPLTEELMVLRVLRELQPGDYVNLGMGTPVLLSDFITPDMGITLQAENGLLGYGPILREDYDPDCRNAGGNPVSLLPGAACFDNAESFAMIRGGHIDVAVLGGMQVSERGDLANYITREGGSGTMGGAVDLAAGARRLIVVMTHVTKDGKPKLVRECIYPLTGRGVVDLVITDLAVVEVTPEGLLLRELAPGYTAGEVQALSEARLLVSEDLREIAL